MNLIAWYRKSFANKIAAQLLLLGFVAILFMSASSLFVSYQVVKSQEDELLAKDLAVARLHVESEINLAVEEFLSLSQNAEIVNGLMDPVQRDAYLKPLLQSPQYQRLRRFTVTLRDYNGRYLLTNRDDVDEQKKALAEPLLPSLVKQGGGVLVTVLDKNQNDLTLELTKAISAPDSNDPQGYFTIQIPVASFLGEWLTPDGSQGNWHIAEGGRGALERNATLIRLTPPLDNLRLNLYLDGVQSSAHSAMKVLLPSFLLVAFLGTLFIWICGRAMGRHFAMPIVCLAENVRTVAETGRVDLGLTKSLRNQIPKNSNDEASHLFLDVAEMLESLHSLQTDLEQQVRRRSATLNTIFELSPDGYLEVDKHGFVGYANSTLFAMLGLEGQSIVGESWDVFRERINRSLVEGQEPLISREFTERMIRIQTPSLRVILIMVKSTNDGDQIFYWRDFTRESELDEMKGAFLAKSAHELRTPMTSILGFTQLLSQSADLTDHHKGILQIIERQGSNLLNLVNDLLEVFRSESIHGKDLRRASNSLGALTKMIVSEFKVPGDDRMVYVSISDHLPEVRLDAGKYRQVLTNLLSNAFKFSPVGSPIEVRERKEFYEGKHWLGIEIRDYGIGMSPIELEQVGKRFFRANPDGEVLGTGLGVSVVQEIMEQHQGRLQFLSQVGEGTTAIVWFVCD